MLLLAAIILTPAFNQCFVKFYCQVNSILKFKVILRGTVVMNLSGLLESSIFFISFLPTPGAPKRDYKTNQV